MPRNVHNRPSARQIQPMGFRGRPEAISAPTTGKAKTGTEVNMSMTVTLSPKVLGSRAERARKNSAMLAKNMAPQRPASDQASQGTARPLTLPTPRSAASSLLPLRHSTGGPSPERCGARYEDDFMCKGSANFGEYPFYALR